MLPLVQFYCQIKVGYSAVLMARFLRRFLLANTPRLLVAVIIDLLFETACIAVLKLEY